MKPQMQVKTVMGIGSGRTKSSIVKREKREIMGVTDDRNDPRLTHGVDAEPTPQAEAYLVLSEKELSLGFVRPVRRSYVHKTCGVVTTMGTSIAETYARDPKFYGATYCVRCSKHLPLDEFVWDPDGSVLGS